MNTFPPRLLLSANLALTIAAPGHAAGSYRFLHEIAVGGEGGWDCLSVDPAGHRLYVSHATKAVVIDTQTDRKSTRLNSSHG